MNCKNCGKFIGPGAYCCVPWGGSATFSPPEPIYICGKCWKKLPGEQQLSMMSKEEYWIPAHILTEVKG